MSGSRQDRSRFRLVLEYDGSGFFGWQLQAQGVTVQGALETALKRLCGHDVRVVGAGRTDSGVHAIGQVAHFDTTNPRPSKTIVRALNAMTPHQLTVLSAEAVDRRFHARNVAVYRQYNYRILIRLQPPALNRGRVWHLPLRLNLETMRAAAVHLLGTHDFSAFRASTCQADSPVRTISRMIVEPMGQEIGIQIGADAFLQHMVRNVVGSLVEVGRGRWTSDHFKSVLMGRDRSRAGPTAPAQGLYLTLVRYGSGPWRQDGHFDEETVSGLDAGHNSGADSGHH